MRPGSQASRPPASLLACLSHPVVMWHGAQRWQGPPEVVPQPPTSAEHGPGIYMTTSAEFAREYAKGGGVLVRFEVDPGLTLLEDVQMPLADAVEFVRSRPRLKSRGVLISDLEANAARMRPREIRLGRATESSPMMIWSEVVLNLFVNHRAIAGDQGPALARFFVEHGIDASIVTRGTDDWLVVFNPKIIRSWRVVPAKHAEDAPRLRGRVGPKDR